VDKAVENIVNFLNKKIKASNLKLKNILQSIVATSITTGSGTSDDYQILKDTSDSKDTCWCQNGILINDGFLKIQVNEFDYNYLYTDSIFGIISKKEVPRTFFMWRWFNMTKTTDSDELTLMSANKNTKFKGRLIKHKEDDSK
jgi:hypothetical protein